MTDPSPSTDRQHRRATFLWLGAGAAIAILAVVIGVAVALGGDGARARSGDYPQDTPERVVDSAYQMLADNRPGQLSGLIYAESPEMRGVLNRLGDLLASAGDLAAAIADQYPDEVARLESEAEQGGAGLLSAVSRARRGGPPQQRDRDLVARLLADPFGWIERNRDRVTTLKTADDRAAVMVDGKPAFGVGLSMLREEGRWQIVLPLNLPFIQQYLPRNRDEWAIVASILEVVDNAVIELRDEVASGQHRDLERVAEAAGEKAAMPMFICVMAYERAMEARRRDAEQLN